MNKLTVLQFCQLETLKSDLNPLIESECECNERTEGSLTVLELTNSKGRIVQELILVV